MHMKNKVAIVTGGGGGIGAASCKALADEGVSVAVVDINLEKARKVAEDITSEGASALAIEVDVTSQKSVCSTVQRVVDHFGKIDFLVHSAGNNIKASFLEMTISEWKESLETHLTGAFLFCQAVGKKIVQQGEGGRIVLMSSVAGITPVPERAGYSPAKAGLISMAAMLSLEWARYNINVNAICPGVTTTPMVEEAYKRDPALKEQRFKRYPMGREAKPKEIADLVVFLCSEKSTYINGTAIPIDGGFLNCAFMPEPETQ